MRSGLLRRCASYWTWPIRSIKTALESCDDEVRILVISWVAFAACGAGASVTLDGGSEAGTLTATGVEAITCEGDDDFECECILHHQAAPRKRAAAVQSRTIRRPGRLKKC